MILLDAKLTMPLHIQLYEALKYEIITELTVGAKLPSIRALAQEYKISKNTVESAYSQLYAEGYIESRPKSGYFVADAEHKPLGSPKAVEPRSVEAPASYRYNFFPARLSKDSFPLKLWKRLCNKALDEHVDFGAYPDPQGEAGLRQEIAFYLTRSRGVRCEASQIVITSGFIDGMSMLTSMLRTDFSAFGIEHPGYHVARKVFEYSGYEIRPIAVDENGLNLDALEKSGAHLIYITPSHQYPTGVTMPIANRLRLLEWARQENALIIEDDYDSEMSYKSRPIPSLQGLDQDERVIYVGTFSKSLSPAIRVGYVVLPYRLIETYKRLHGYFPKVSLSTQKTLELFMAGGHWDRHLRKIRTLNRKKHDLMKTAILKYLGESVEIVSEGGGLAINIRPTTEIDLDQLQIDAQAAGIKLYFAKQNSGGEWEAIRMGFGGFEEEEIDAAVKAFASVWRK